MRQLIALVKRKPHWLPSEGYWRILQILRMVAFAPLALAGVVCIGAAIIEHDRYFKEIAGMGLLWVALGVAGFVAVHGAAWMIVWVLDGFSESKNS
ncbi:hypothetical protein DM813_18960 [Pseudomonas alkylphenolica]|uniref:Uncharacterized protein n=1 Tax=Pseudomonas alkylphenolica TaxID=237609 RepID=A0A443ZQB1_9PSED|nr:hypothetical protein [Pseudomonas alkylphenolica]RWU21270.1 hypothetical protein DM813_18960 [Pseudomonas alkylphenolica]